jgi:hypothetical protein
MHNLQILKKFDQKKSVQNWMKLGGPMHWRPKPIYLKGEVSSSKTLAVRAFSKSEILDLE